MNNLRVIGIPEMNKAAAEMAAGSAGGRIVFVAGPIEGMARVLDDICQKAPKGAHKDDFAKFRDMCQSAAREAGLSCAFDGELRTLERLTSGAALTGEMTARLKARIKSLGAKAGASFLRAVCERRGRIAGVLDPNAYLGNLSSDYIDASISSLPDGDFFIMPGGYAAHDGNGKDLFLLGDGSADISTALLAARLKADAAELWLEVPGFYTASPELVPEGRLLVKLDYDEAQEMATSGSSLIHPGCIEPLRKARIPLQFRSYAHPEIIGTRVEDAGNVSAVKALSLRRGVCLISLDGIGMWQQVGFLANVFKVFAKHNLSLDLVATSQTNVTVSLDTPVMPGSDILDPLFADLEQFCQPRLIAPCAAITMVGTKIRSNLHKIGPVLELFEEEKVHLVSQAASDLNFTFVVDERQAERLVTLLHAQLFQDHANKELFGSSWREVFSQEQAGNCGDLFWWKSHRDGLLKLAEQEKEPVYVYHKETLEKSMRNLLNLKGVSQVMFAMKANPFPPVLKLFEQMGSGFECVSIYEAELVRSLFPDLPRTKLLFTPNFADSEDYAKAFSLNALVTLDNIEPLSIWPEVFRGREVFLRLDLGAGAGHHKKVMTAGNASKFGISLDLLPALRQKLNELDIKVIGLHSHSGSGIKKTDTWAKTAARLSEIAEMFPSVRVLDLGGGLGVAERSDSFSLDLQAAGSILDEFRRAHDFEIWIEPGRYPVAHAGIILARVTQTKVKGTRHFIGINAGMNTLIRPALYGAYHEISNLTRLNEENAYMADIVGPICETGDTLGRDRFVPETYPGDIMVISSAGAYGQAMSSNYNMRPKAEEILY